jgi:hypothetical protein
MANFDLQRLPVKAGRQLKALVDGIQDFCGPTLANRSWFSNCSGV